MTHTFATLAVSQAVYDEVAQKLLDAGYDHAFVDGLICMHGIALEREAPPAAGRDHYSTGGHRGGADYGGA